MIKRSQVIFATESLEKSFNNLEGSDELKKFLIRAIKDLEKNAFSGIQIPKRLIPKEYIQKYKINNLWKYNLPNGWRLIYSVITPNKVELMSVILEWFNHKEYKRRMKY
jgi:Txe/YoeB family toxin of Txe-Axe toxin-antitoxin module